jgi:hypothetical protein
MYSSSLPISWTTETSRNVNLQKFCENISKEGFPATSSHISKSLWFNKCIANTRAILTNEILKKKISDDNLDIKNGDLILLTEQNSQWAKKLKKINDEPFNKYLKSVGFLNRRVDVTLSELGNCGLKSLQEIY